ncbi:MAG: VOC family protein [Candidatus Dormibacteria bacterium]|jgi:lactoylglutathione lyase
MSQWSEQPKDIGAVTLFVDDLGAAKQFYQNAFGLPVYYEDVNSAVFQFGSVLINLLDSAEADALIAPATVGSSGAGARSQFTIHVSDVDAVCATLQERGIAPLNGPMNRPWGIRTAAFADPSGHIWEIAQELS